MGHEIILKYINKLLSIKIDQARKKDKHYKSILQLSEIQIKPNRVVLNFVITDNNTEIVYTLHVIIHNKHISMDQSHIKFNNINLITPNLKERNIIINFIYKPNTPNIIETIIDTSDIKIYTEYYMTSHEFTKFIKARNRSRVPVVLPERDIPNMITTISLIKFCIDELFTSINKISPKLELPNPIRDISEIIQNPGLQRMLSETREKNFKKKYLKYKEKYLRLKQNLN
jgi:hypothetical protein